METKLACTVLIVEVKSLLVIAVEVKRKMLNVYQLE